MKWYAYPVGVMLCIGIAIATLIAIPFIIGAWAIREVNKRWDLNV